MEKRADRQFGLMITLLEPRRTLEVRRMEERRRKRLALGKMARSKANYDRARVATSPWKLRL